MSEEETINVPDTSEEYDDCVGKIGEEYKPVTINEFLGEEDKLTPEDENEAWDQLNWKRHWKGMPGYESEDQMPVKRLIVNFETEEDYEAFKKLNGYERLTMKTKTVWWPDKERNELITLRWVDEGDV